MLRLFVAASFGALLASVPAVAAVVVTNAPGAPDQGMAVGERLVVSFDAANAQGVSNVTSGNVTTAAGSIGGVRAAPAGTPDDNIYQSIGTGGSSTFDFSQFTDGSGLSSASFYWGSVDAYNFVDVLNAGGTVIHTLSGTDLPQFNGDQSAAITNQRVFFRFDQQDLVTALRLRSTGVAFEFDNIAVGRAFGSDDGAAGAVPEPTTWAMLFVGFGMIGAMMRRPRTKAVSA